MAWTSPRTWVAGELVTASLMNTHVRDNLSYLKAQVDLALLNTTTLGAVSSLTTLSAGNNNNLATPSSLFWLLDGSAGGCVLTGATGADGRLVLAVCVAGSFTLSGEDANSSAANRFKSSSGLIAAGQTVALAYVAGAYNRWHYF